MTNRFKGSGFTFSTQLFAWVPLQTLFDFSQLFCFFIITLVSEIVKEKLCRYRKYYRANKIGLSRAPAPTFTFENLPIQCYETKRATKGRPYSYSTVCYAAKSLRSVFPLLCVGVQLGLTPPFLTPHLLQYSPDSVYLSAILDICKRLYSDPIICTHGMDYFPTAYIHCYMAIVITDYQVACFYIL